MEGLCVSSDEMVHIIFFNYYFSIISFHVFWLNHFDQCLFLLDYLKVEIVSTKRSTSESFGEDGYLDTPRPSGGYLVRSMMALWSSC